MIWGMNNQELVEFCRMGENGHNWGVACRAQFGFQAKPPPTSPERSAVKIIADKEITHPG